MLTESDLKQLLNYQPNRPVLSVYLNTDPVAGNADVYRLKLRNMLKDINLPDDVAAVERYFDYDFDWSGRSVAVFSCAADKYFQAIPLAIPVRSRVRIDNHPHVKPLADLLDFYGGYGVALVDKQGIRLFYFHLGELQEEEEMTGQAIKRAKRGGASSFPGRRGGIAGRTDHMDEMIDRNMKEAAELANRFFKDKNVRRILLGGTEDNVSLFRNLLPKSWQSLIVGAFPIAFHASKDEVLQKAVQICKEAEAQQETHLVDVMLTNAAKKRGGVLNLDDTLQAVHDGKVQTLLIREGFRAPGYRCQGCGYLTSKELKSCPYCGGSFQGIPDAAELAVRAAMQAGAEVEVLHTDYKLKEFGGIGAILRY